MMAVEHVIRDGQRIEVETLESRAVPKRRRPDQHHEEGPKWRISQAKR
jgi:hypothetical protein